MKISIALPSILPFILLSCSSGDIDPPSEFEFLVASSDQLSVPDGLLSADELGLSEDHIYIPNSQLEQLALEPGQQVRVWLDDGTDGDCDDPIAPSLGCEYSFIFTIEEPPGGSLPSQPALDSEGHDRLANVIDDYDPSAGIILDVRVADPGTDLDDHVYGNLLQRDVVVLAPHGGKIEVGTDVQAMAVCDEYPGTFAAWYASGSGYDQHKRLHVTSGELSPNPGSAGVESFPDLAALGQRRYTHAVSFHGTSGSGSCSSSDYCIYVGGGAGSESRQSRLAKRIRAALQPGSPSVLQCDDGPVDISGKTFLVTTDVPAHLAGVSPGNIVNWMTVDGDDGIQIEQTKPIRQDCALTVAREVADFYKDLL